MEKALLIIAYNEAEHIAKVIRQWKGLVDRIVVLVSSRPWNGTPVEDDGTADIARREGAEVIIQYWRTEAEQRNYGLALLYNYYVIMLDADELFIEEDRKKILEAIRTNEPCYRCGKVVTYWKTLDYVFSPPDKHQPIIAVDPKRVKFLEHRQPMPVTEFILQQYQPVIDVTMQHLSWIKSDEKVREKISSYSHCNDISPLWYDEVWMKWTPGSEILVRPYGAEKSIATYSPAPSCIRNA